MALNLTVTAERLAALKAKVKAEMQNRNATEHGMSMNKFAGSEWDYNTNPKDGQPILSEHVGKIIDPLLQIADFQQDNSLIGDRATSIPTLEAAEKFVDNLSKIEKTASESGCRGSCAGLCTEACSGECTGCSSCSGGCSSSCNKACSSDCGGGCSGCSGGCHTGCSATCGSGCTTSLRY